MKVLKVENLTKSYGDKTLFDGISFNVAEKERIGVIGINGTGKSTLLKMIAGIESSDKGEISHPKDYTISYLPQGPTFHEDHTVLEEVFYGDSPMMQLFRDYEKIMQQLQADPVNEKKQEALFNVQQKMDSMNAWDANTQAKMILTRLGIEDFSATVSQLSGGQKKRVAMAKSLIQPADLLIMDEPTNHLDHRTIEWLEGFLSNYKQSFIIITHDRYFLDRVTNRIVELDKGQLYSYTGNYSSFLEAKANREAEETATYEKRKNLLRRELEWIRRGAKARTTKQKARIQRFEKLKDKTQKVEKENLNIALGGTRLGKKVLEIENISKELGSKALIRDFSMLIQPFDRIGIVGENGSGKTTLLNILAGKMKVDTGEIDVGSTVKIGYYTQENEDMDDSQRVIEYIQETAQVIKTIDGDTITASQMLERFLFSSQMQYTMISRLSGGERRRLYLLKVLMEEPNVLLLDEPTNDLDTETLTILEDYLEQFPGVVITVSHDRYFLDKTVGELLVFEGDGHVGHYYGSYSEYLEERETQEQLKKQEKPSIDENIKSEEKKTSKRKLSYKDQKEWEGIEDKITSLEEKIEEIKEEIIATGSDFEKAQRLYKEQEELSLELDETMERWEELSLMIEDMND